MAPSAHHTGRQLHTMFLGENPARRRGRALLLLAATSIGVLLAPLLPTAAAAAAPTGIDGAGTAAAPYQVDSAADLVHIAEWINTNSAALASSHIDIVADIDMSSAAPFPGFDTFTGVLNGRGHSISGMTYGNRDAAGGRLGLIQHLNGGTVANLTLDRVSADNAASTGFVAGIAVVATNATVIGNTVIDAQLTAAAAEKVAGLVAEADGGTISDNYVDATIVAAEMPAGVAAYSKNATTIARNLVSAELTMVIPGGDNGTRGNNAGFVLAYPGTPNAGTYTANVALSGSINYFGKIDGFAGRIIGYTDYNGWTASDNLASTSITISGNPVAGPGTKNQHGIDTSPADLALQTSYEALGWDFANVWSWDAILGHPVPRYSYSLAGAGTATSPFEIATASDLDFLAEQLNAGNTRYTKATNFILTNDLDFTDRAPFVGIDTFTATLEGRGHSITDVVYGPSSSKRLGFIRSLTGGTIRNLNLNGVTAHSASTSEGDWVGGIAVVATDAVIEGSSVIAADLRAAGVEKVSLLAAELRGASVVQDNWLDGTVVAKKMPAGVSSYAHNATMIRRNLVSADLTVAQDGGNGTRGVDAGLLAAYPGSGNTVTISENVALSGSIVYTGTVPGFAGRILGYYQASGAYAVTLSNNLANEQIPVSGDVVTGSRSDQHGEDTSAAALGERTTYEQLGWDFSADWAFDAARGHPVPRYVDPADLPNRITTTFYGDPTTQRAFTWYTQLGTKGVIELSTSRDLSNAISTAAERKTGQDGETFYQGVADNLSPGTRYYYRLGDPDGQTWSSTGTFTTSDGSSDFTFIDLTDTQSQNTAEAELSATTLSKALASIPHAEFVMHNGDVVERGGVEQDWRDLLNAARPSLLSTTIAPVAGNHEEARDSFVDHFAVEAPHGQDTATGAYYSFDYNSAHFAMLNTNEDRSQNVSAAQIDWLRHDVLTARARGAQWIIVTMHKGIYTTSNHLDDADIIAARDVLAPLIDELDIDLVLQGHDHVMSRTKQLVYDPAGVEGARAVETDVITEMVGGKRTEYAISPEGTVHFLPNTAGAKHYSQASGAQNGGIDLEAYLQLFDRTGEQNTENFVAVNVTEGRLTVDVYDIRDKGQPRLFESFGIDREICPVDEKIAALPSVPSLTAADAQAVTTVRGEVNALTSAQQGGLKNLNELLTREARIRELTGAVSTDGAGVAWAATDAERRQTLTIRNSTRTTFTDTPVRLELSDTGIEDPTAIAFTTTDGIPLPYEVESWNGQGKSVVWVQVPELRTGATTIWGYYGTSEHTNDPTAVWDDYTLVEHFGVAPESATPLVDSTGQHRGQLVGDIAATVDPEGDGIAQFGAGRLQYSGDVGGQQDRITISSVVVLTTDQLAALTGNAPIVAKEPKNAEGLTTFWQGIVKDTGQVGTRLSGNSFEFGTVDLNHRFTLPADAQKHLVTQVYDGMTYSVFVDGKEVHAQMVEYRSTYGDPRVLTTIGDYYTADGALSSPFTGAIAEVQIAGIPFTPDFEKFRYQNYLGSAVSYGKVISQGSDQVTLALETPVTGSAIEAGLVSVTGTLSQRATLVAEVAGQEVLRARTDAGAFSVHVPVNALGEQRLGLRAEAAGSSAQEWIDLRISDTVAPAMPEVHDDAASAQRIGEDVQLTVTPDSNDREELRTTFYAKSTVPLTAQNTQVRTGTSTDRTPDALTPDSGTATAETLPTTVGGDSNPYQIYQVTLTEAQADQGLVHFAWKGVGDQRRVSAYVWDDGHSSWTLSDTGSSATSEAFTLDIAAGAEAIAADRTVSILIWRGLASSPWQTGTDYRVEPDAADYDWGLDHVPDTQLYAQATPELMVDQFRYVASRAADRDTRLVVQSGDLVNREYLSQEYQWRNAERAVRLLEEAQLPYLVSWGNHDYSDPRNNRVMLPKYYPMERFAASLGGSDWTFGGSNNIDNYYYTGELAGAKLLVLTLGFFSSDNAGDAGLTWASDVIATHPDHSVILAMHNSVNTGTNNWSNGNITNRLVIPHSNVKLVLGGHITGTGVASLQRPDGTLAHGILTDYQGRVYGGQEYLRHLSIDAENGLLYSNTYSPLLDKTTSEGAWHQKIDESKIPGFHGTDSENFVLELDLPGTTTRTLSTSALSLTVGDPVQIGTPASSIGSAPIEMVLSGAAPGVEYAWYADLVDAAGNTTRSQVSTFTIVPEGTRAPDAPTAVTASAVGTTAHVSWLAPAHDGGTPVTAFEVTVGTRAVTVGTGTLSAAVDMLPAGEHQVTVRALNAAGWSAPSAPTTLTITTEGETSSAALVVTGDFVPGGQIVISGSGFEALAPYELELNSEPASLGSVTADAAGAFRFTATLPSTTVAGEHDVVAIANDAIVASARILVTAVSTPGTGTDPDKGLEGNLAATGGESGAVTWLIAGAMILLLTALLFLIRRRRVSEA